MAYTTIDDPTAYFQVKTYTGNGSTNAITFDGNTNMQPDFVWIKDRDTSQHHRLADVVRGVKKNLKSDQADAENTPDSNNGLQSFDSNGFTLTQDSSDHGYNASGSSQVSWNWKAGTSFTNDASSTGVGSIDSAGSFNNDAGFSIVTYTGNGSSGATVKHGMNQKPSMFIIKDRDNSNEGWMVYHTSLGATKYMRLNETGAAATGSAYFNNTEPTSSVFTIGNNDVVNKSGDKYVTYCFAPKQGYSKFGSYTGNGNADGTFVYTGFKPAWVMVKRTDSSDAANWMMYDNKRLGYNGGSRYLIANDSGAASGSSDNLMDFTSNGFKPRSASQNINRSATYIYMAFAESPFVNSNGVPNNAR